ncbi:dihydrofolate reductase [Phycicoccus sp. MAQZ13P-2]|uniref:dihydrofolate reductase n=1 Tax=Phycicoccus mangrovi TaxID=2840470 RepID=UPI001BFFE4F7|nr:dihydrofolate reductase [Phycicoccus mangrovi]MBT9255682.1 dihydrofolate reductase [Phycicoccus mangrovi]MBT9274275.1 dihydrofolate reductase [Phycicoccus mangrovi]
MTRVSLIAAVARNGVIGAGQSMPWHLPEDFAFFRRTTMGHPLVMGRRTFDSIGRVLPGRRHIVITRQPDWAHAEVETAHSLVEALALAGPADEVFVAGGGQVYAEAMPYAHRLLVTEVDLEPEGDTHFPPVDPGTWVETERVPGERCAWVTYERR